MVTIHLYSNIIDQQHWMLTNEVDKTDWVNIENLKIGEVYEIQLVAKGNFGEIVSITKQLIVGKPIGKFYF